MNKCESCHYYIKWKEDEKPLCEFHQRIKDGTCEFWRDKEIPIKKIETFLK